jgi:putative addiction module component (TIGR02574 family)
MNDRVDSLTEEVRQPTDNERVELLDGLWELIRVGSHALPVPQWHRDELDRRAADYEADPRAALPWDDVKARRLARTRS